MQFLPVILPVKKQLSYKNYLSKYKLAYSENLLKNNFFLKIFSYLIFPLGNAINAKEKFVESILSNFN